MDIKQEVKEEDSWCPPPSDTGINSLAYPPHSPYRLPLYHPTETQNKAVAENIATQRAILSAKRYFSSSAFDPSYLNPSLKTSPKMSFFRPEVDAGSYSSYHGNVSSMSRPLINGSSESYNTISRSQYLPSVENLTRLFRIIPEHFAVSNAAGGCYSSTQAGGSHSHIPHPIRYTPHPAINQTAAASTLRNILHPCPVRQFPTDLQWASHISPYQSPFNMMHADPLLHYSSVLLPRTNTSSVDIQQKIDSIYDKAYLRDLQR